MASILFLFGTDFLGNMGFLGSFLVGLLRKWTLYLIFLIFMPLGPLMTFFMDFLAFMTAFLGASSALASLAADASTFLGAGLGALASLSFFAPFLGGIILLVK